MTNRLAQYNGGKLQDALRDKDSASSKDLQSSYKAHIDKAIRKALHQINVTHNISIDIDYCNIKISGKPRSLSDDIKKTDVSHPELLTFVNNLNVVFTTDDKTPQLTQLHSVKVPKSLLCQSLMDNIQQLMTENERLKQLFSATYSLKSSFLITMLATIGFAAALLLNYGLEVTVIHPLLAIVGLSMSLSFAALVAWRLFDKRGK